MIAEYLHESNHVDLLQLYFQDHHEPLTASNSKENCLLF